MTTKNHNYTATIANDIQKSLYIAALDRYLGLRGLTNAVTDGESDLDYDFLHFASGTFIKMVGPVDLADVDRYQKARPAQCVFIVDATTLTKPLGGAHMSALDCEEVCRAALELDAYVYLADRFWVLGEETFEWTPVLPVERQLCLNAITNMNRE